jgi:hypothetical protein
MDAMPFAYCELVAEATKLTDDDACELVEGDVYGHNRNRPIFIEFSDKRATAASLDRSGCSLRGRLTFR